MPIAFNGSGTISGISTGGISDAKAVADAAMPAGAILQMQSTLKTDYSSMNNTSFSDIGGLSVSITPIFSNSKIIVTLTCAIGHKNNEYGSIKIVQNSSGSFADIDVGNAFTADNGNAMSPGNITTDDPTDDYGQYKVFYWILYHSSFSCNY